MDKQESREIGLRSEGVTVAICVPVRDEAAALPSLLDALAGLDRRGLAVTFCCYLDSCTDASEALLRAAPVRVEVGPMRADANAGRARAAAMAMGLATVGYEAGALLLSTDADSRPRSDWLQAACAALAVADVAAGRIECDRVDARQVRVERYYDRLHGYRRAVDPVPWEAGGCHHAGGANLAVRADVYHALGGFLPLPAGEDARLLDDAARAGFRVRHDPAMAVETSARRIGRVPGGLATSLDALAANGLPRVQHPAAAAWQYARHALARAMFARGDWAAVGQAVGLSADHVLGVARDCPNAEAFAMRIVPAAPDAARLVPLAEAERALAALELALCRGAA
ncbi:glycosyltransferase [Sphingomonas sp.]|uniref:glycosyltransferase n=1 Tax=Sphingomonas sp. TaxID=28214 RepID=UPI003AFF6B18